MGNINPSVLYLDLLEDLQPYLPSDVYEAFIDERDVDYWPGIGIKSVAAVSMAKAFLKKFQDRPLPGADRVALDKFLQINERCKNYKFPGTKWSDTSCLEQEYVNQLLGELRSSLWKFYDSMPSVTFGSILERGRTGPGASLGAIGTDFYSKMFCSTLTTTRESLHRVFQLYINSMPRWQSANEMRKSLCEDVLIIEGNRLSFVPKTVDVSRTICTEPSINMVFQLGLGELIADHLKRAFGLNLEDQQMRNRELARIGSETGRLATIDLSSASDSLSITMLREVLPSGLNHWLHLLRSPYSQLPDGRMTELHMISTMGNGYTFPLQTLLFACVVHAVYRCRGHKIVHPYGRRLGNYAVNGDDIIVVDDCYDDVVRLLTLLGFEVNAKKSFNTGFFRESCGLDAWSGIDVRGVYCKTLKTPQDRYSLINRLNRWAARHRIPLWRTVHRLLETVRPIWAPRNEQDVAGIHVPKWALGHALQREHGSYLYKRYVARPALLRVKDDSIVVPRGQKRRPVNPDGLIIAALMGVLRDHSISVRHDWCSYDLRRGVCPNWDAPPASSSLDCQSWRYWESIVGALVP